MKKRKPWSSHEIEVLKNSYETHTIKALAKMLDRSEKSVEFKIRMLGLKKIGKAKVKEIKKWSCKACKVRNKVGTTYSGSDLYYCPFFNTTIGDDAIPLPDCPNKGEIVVRLKEKIGGDEK